MTMFEKNKNMNMNKKIERLEAIVEKLYHVFAVLVPVPVLFPVLVSVPVQSLIVAVVPVSWCCTKNKTNGNQCSKNARPNEVTCSIHSTADKVFESVKKLTCGDLGGRKKGKENVHCNNPAKDGKRCHHHIDK